MREIGKAFSGSTRHGVRGYRALFAHVFRYSLFNRRKVEVSELTATDGTTAVRDIGGALGRSRDFLLAFSNVTRLRG